MLSFLFFLGPNCPRWWNGSRHDELARVMLCPAIFWFSDPNPTPYTPILNFRCWRFEKTGTVYRRSFSDRPQNCGDWRDDPYPRCRIVPCWSFSSSIKFCYPQSKYALVRRHGPGSLFFLLCPDCPKWWNAAPVIPYEVLNTVFKTRTLWFWNPITVGACYYVFQKLTPLSR